jgi:hypothetical protein
LPNVNEQPKKSACLGLPPGAGGDEIRRPKASVRLLTS